MSAQLDAEWQDVCDRVAERLHPVPVLPTVKPQALPSTAEAR